MIVKHKWIPCWPITSMSLIRRAPLRLRKPPSIKPALIVPRTRPTLLRLATNSSIHQVPVRPCSTGTLHKIKMSELQHSEACCTIPPFTGSDYEPVGTYETIAGTFAIELNSQTQTVISRYTSPVIRSPMLELFVFTVLTFGVGRVPALT